jgi:hypothetical protein
MKVNAACTLRKIIVYRADNLALKIGERRRIVWRSDLSHHTPDGSNAEAAFSGLPTVSSAAAAVLEMLDR